MTDREKFEAWASDDGQFPRAVEKRGDTYILLATQAKWETWQAAIASQNESGGGWIEWCGGECPVQGNPAVEVRLKDGTVSSAWLAKGWVWEHGVLSPGADIIAYRTIP